jgi:hypothetical protein
LFIVLSSFLCDSCQRFGDRLFIQDKIISSLIVENEILRRNMSKSVVPEESFDEFRTKPFLRIPNRVETGSKQLLRDNVLTKRVAYVFFATTDVHARAVLAVVRRIRHLGVRKEAEFVVISDIERNWEGVIRTPMDKEIPLTRDHTFAWSFQKLQAFRMTQYRRVMVLDADSWINLSIDHLFDLPEVEVAAPVANWARDFCVSGALFLVTPSTLTWGKRILPRIKTYAEKSKSEMNVINEAYEHKIGSNRILPEMLILPSKYMTLSTEFVHSEPYHENKTALWDETHIFHFSGGLGKPWSLSGIKSDNENMRRLHKNYLSYYDQVPAK